MTKEKILLVDDDRNLLAALRRNLRGSFDLSVAASGKEALETIAKDGPFAVLVADMQMPEMNGVQLLQEVKKVAPTTVRMMLTGNADQETAVLALNDGQIFRFLNKPCSPDDLQQAIISGISYYRAICAEKELLQKTLTGSVKVLTDLLAIIDSRAFGNTLDTRTLVRQLASEDRDINVWEVELATMLSGLSTALIPRDLAQKIQRGLPLTESEKAVADSAPDTVRGLIRNIPRLETVAEIVYLQATDLSYSATGQAEKLSKNLVKSAQLVRVIRDYAVLRSKNLSAGRAVEELRKRGWYDTEILVRLASHVGAQSGVDSEVEQFNVTIKELCVGQLLLADVRTKDGRLLITSGSTVTETLISRIKNYAALGGVTEPIVVNARIPTNTDLDSANRSVV